MTLKDLGFTNKLEQYRIENNLDSFEVARVSSEHKERYVVKTLNAEYEAEILGNLRFTAQSRADFPAVGDWVAISEYDKDKALIHAIYPRRSIIERQAVGKHGDKQIIATNVDFALIVQAVDRDFNVNRLERYLTLCYNSNIQAYIVLNKVDLIDDDKLTSLQQEISKRIKDTPTITISNNTKYGYDQLELILKAGKTFCLLGSSGVGKSTLTNNLMGNKLLKTLEISESTSKGKHTTSHRELFVLSNGAILIDNPGLREVGIADSEIGIEQTFEVIAQAAENCRYKDCTHTNEKGCAVIQLVNNGELDEETYENYLKIEREKTHFELSVADKRKKDKDFGKMINNVKRDISKLSHKHKNR